VFITSQLSIKSYFNVVSSAPIVIDVSGDDADDDDDDDNWASEDDVQPLSALMARSARQAAARQAARRAQSAAPQAVRRRSQRGVRRSLSDISNVRNRGDRSAESLRQYARTKSRYQELRTQLAHPADRSKCAYCGVWEHSAIHHEGGFTRAGVVSSYCMPSAVHH
jgi:hypothetical protein